MRGLLGDPESSASSRPTRAWRRPSRRRPRRSHLVGSGSVRPRIPRTSPCSAVRLSFSWRSARSPLPSSQRRPVGWERRTVDVRCQRAASCLVRCGFSSLCVAVPAADVTVGLAPGSGEYVEWGDRISHRRDAEHNSVCCPTRRESDSRRSPRSRAGPSNGSHGTAASAARPRTEVRVSPRSPLWQRARQPVARHPAG
jgi:hypothetical protein